MWKPVQIYVIRPPSVTPMWIEELTVGVGFEPVDEYLSSPKYETRPKDLILAYDHNSINIQSAYVMKNSIKQKVGGFRKRVSRNFGEVEYGYAWNTAYEDSAARQLPVMLDRYSTENFNTYAKLVCFATARSIIDVCKFLNVELSQKTMISMRHLSSVTDSNFPREINFEEIVDDITVEKLLRAANSLRSSVRHYGYDYDDTRRYTVDLYALYSAITDLERAASELRKDGQEYVASRMKEIVSFDKMMDYL